jgi:hypothetical protein
MGLVVNEVLSAASWPEVKGSPWLVIDEIAHRTLARGAEARRGALAKALRERWKEAAGLSERVFLLRQLALVGEESSAPFLAGLLEEDDPVVREYALRALADNPSAAAGRAVVDAFEKGGPTAWRLSLANALDFRGDPTVAAKLKELHAAEADGGVRDALEAGLGRLESR